MKKPIGKKGKKPDRHMTYEEFSKILKHLKEKKDFFYYCLFLTQAGLGRRISETVAIQLQDFTNDFRKVKIRLAKTDEVREFKVPRKLASLLFYYCKQNYKEIMARDGYLFYSFNHMCTEKHISNKRAWQRLREVVDAININDKFDFHGKVAFRIGTHSLRRLTITGLLRQTKDVIFVQQWVGHGDPRVTMDYADKQKLLDTEEQEVTEHFEKLINPLPEEKPQFDKCQVPLKVFI